MLFSFLDHFLPLDSFVSIQIQMVVWHVNNLDCWPLSIFCLVFLLYLRYAIHALEYGSQKSFIVTHISTCFLINFVFCCFLCFLICLFHVLWFLSLFQVFSCFHVFSFLFISFHVLSFLFLFSVSFCLKSFYVFSLLFISFHIVFFLEKTITNPDHLQFDKLLSFADWCPWMSMDVQILFVCICLSMFVWGCDTTKWQQTLP